MFDQLPLSSSLSWPSARLGMAALPIYPRQQTGGRKGAHHHAFEADVRRTEKFRRGERSERAARPDSRAGKNSCDRLRASARALPANREDMEAAPYSAPRKDRADE